jgi:hypothetical protein
VSRTKKRPSSKISASCENHGGCPWCEGNRTIKDRRLKQFAADQEQDTGDPCQDGNCPECWSALE